MTDKAWQFQKDCEEAAVELWAELVEEIKHGEPEKYPTDRIWSIADDITPLPTYQRWELVEFLEDKWDEAKEADSLDSALGTAICMKAEEFISAKFYEFGGEERLEKLNEVMLTVNACMEECDVVTYEQICDEFSSELEELGVETELPEQPKKELKP